jgi:hypothetical protein
MTATGKIRKTVLLPLSQTAMRFYGRVAYHDFEGPAISGDVLRGHGDHAC